MQSLTLDKNRPLLGFKGNFGLLALSNGGVILVVALCLQRKFLVL